MGVKFSERAQERREYGDYLFERWQSLCGLYEIRHEQKEIGRAGSGTPLLRHEWRAFLRAGEAEIDIDGWLWDDEIDSSNPIDRAEAVAACNLHRRRMAENSKTQGGSDV